MRNIICISAICIAMAGQGLAEANLTQGCFLRDYSDAHLAKHPKQIVDWIRLKVFKDQYNQTVADMDVYMAHQGHVVQSGHAGQVLAAVLHCWESQGRVGCGVD